MEFSLTLEMRLLPIGGGGIARFFHFSLFRPFQNESMRLSVRVGLVYLAPIKASMDTNRWHGFLQNLMSHTLLFAQECVKGKSRVKIIQ
jgi:hypothetical protein